MATAIPSQSSSAIPDYMNNNNDNYDLWLYMQSRLSGIIYNWDLRRKHVPFSAMTSMDATTTLSAAVDVPKRREGFTEIWGCNDDDDDDDDDEEGKYAHGDKSKASAAASSLHQRRWKWFGKVPMPADHFVNSSFSCDDTAMPVDVEDVSVELVQYRPAWGEQLALRTAKIPFVVRNSPYAVSETVGPLPYLMDLGVFVRNGGMDGASSKQQQTQQTQIQQQEPIWVGRQSLFDLGGDDGVVGMSGQDNTNAILNYYIRHIRGVDLDAGLSSEQRTLSILWTQMIQTTLVPLLTVCRYGASGTDNSINTEAWYQVNRPQSLLAATTASSTTTSTTTSTSPWQWLRFLAAWQVWGERVHAMTHLPGNVRGMTMPHVIAQVRHVYALLEQHLEQERNKKQGESQSQQDAASYPDKANVPRKIIYLLGTKNPTTVDCLLFDHLIQALADVHLVIVMADFPILCRYVQDIWNEYFVIDDYDSCPVWRLWNARENAANAFSQLPFQQQQRRTTSPSTSSFTHAMELMEQLTVTSTGLESNNNNPNALADRLALIAAKRREQERERHRALYDGDAAHKTAKPTATAADGSDPEKQQQQQQRDKLYRNMERNDELWIGTVLITSVLALGLSGIFSTRKPQ